MKRLIVLTLVIASFGTNTAAQKDDVRNLNVRKEVRADIIKAAGLDMLQDGLIIDGMTWRSI